MKPTLVVLAAGLGSRFGGLKQMEVFGPSGETLLDYTVHDAIEVGFVKIVFVIRESFREEFIKNITIHFGNRVDLEFVNQDLDDLPNGFNNPEQRTKPWGTGHAIWSTRNVISTPFCIVNADDFYGRSALKQMHDKLLEMKDHQFDGCLIGYRLGSTLSDFGSVSRGICEIENGYLISIKEIKEIAKKGDVIIGSESEELDENTVVSMNLIGFSSSIFSIIESEFERFLSQNLEDLKSEFYAPSILQSLIKNGENVPVEVTNSTWFGVTYADDKPVVQSKLNELIEAGVYPKSLC